MKTLIDVTCEQCGKVFQIAPGRLKHGRGKYCSRECKYNAVKPAPKQTYTHTCKRCGKAFAATTRRHSTYCSKECAYPKITATCQHCGKTFHTTPSAHSKFCSKACAYSSVSRSAQAREKALDAWANPESRQRLMDGIAKRSNMPEWYSSPHFQKGPAHPRYAGNRRGRECETSRYQYKVWHKAVLAKDNYTCQDCGERGGRLTAHHVQAWADMPGLRYDVNNGVALCYPCHDKRHGRTPKPLTRECAHCGQTFQLHKNRQRFCSIQCAVQHRASQSA